MYEYNKGEFMVAFVDVKRLTLAYRSTTIIKFWCDSNDSFHSL